MKARVLQISMLMTLGLSILFLLTLCVFEVLPATTGNNDLIILQQANFQLARTEFMVKDVFALAYRGDTARAQSISELQIQEPMFERVQTGLLNGDASLGLPDNPSLGVKESLVSAQPDYLAIVAAIKTMLSNPDKTPDPVQVQIVAQHERPYLVNMYPVTTLLTQEAQTRVTQFLIIKMSLTGATILLVCLKYLLFTQKVVKKMIDEENVTNNLSRSSYL